VVGTSSVRRVMQVKAARPDLIVRPVRGNVDTRLKKLDDSEFDAIILAAAGLERLGLSHRITELLLPESFWPAVAQGALVVQIRADDDSVAAAVAALDDRAAHDAVRAERSFLAALAGGCLAPIGGWAHVGADGRLELGGCVLEQRGGSVDRIMARAASDLSGVAPEALGRTVADDLLRQGANAMLARMRRHVAADGGTR
jgi:hydroxymethylbilane synthase